MVNLTNIKKSVLNIDRLTLAKAKGNAYCNDDSGSSYFFTSAIAGAVSPLTGGGW